MKTTLKLFVLFFFISLKTFSQLNSPCNCKSSPKLFNEFNDLVYNRKFKEAEIILQKIKTLDKECEFTRLNALVAVNVGLKEFNKVDSIIEIIQTKFLKGKDKYQIASYYLESGIYLVKANKLDTAFSNFIKGRELSIELKDKEMEYYADFNIGNLFTVMRQSDKSIDYDKKALLIAKDLNDVKKEVRILSNIQAHFGVWFDISEDIRYIDSVDKYTSVTLYLAKKNNLKSDIAQTFSVIAGTYYARRDPKSMLIYADSALKYLDRNADFRFIHSAFVKKSSAYILLNQFDKAKSCADSSLKYSTKEGQALSIARSYEELYEIEKMAGNYKSSIYYLERFTKIRDSIRTIDKTKAINDLEEKYNKVENEKKINELNHQKEIAESEGKLRTRTFLIVIALIVLVLMLIVFFYRQSVNKNKIKTIEIEQRLNRARMNPHFFFNALTSIQSLSEDENEENTRKVPLLISKFSKIMRQSLESTYDEMVSVEQEVSFITNYLELQKSRYNNKFDYNIELEGDFDETEVKLPGMLLQPFIENSIEHGFKNLTYKGILEIVIGVEKEQLIITCKDNGSGLQTAKKKKVYPSRASQIIRERLELLNKKYHSKAHFDINSVETGGVEIKVYLPLVK